MHDWKVDDKSPHPPFVNGGNISRNLGDVVFFYLILCLELSILIENRKVFRKVKESCGIVV